MTYIERIGADNLPADGVAVDSIARGIGSSLEEVAEEVDNLLGEGQLYTTSDSDQCVFGLYCRPRRLNMLTPSASYRSSRRSTLGSQCVYAKSHHFPSAFASSLYVLLERQALLLCCST